MAKKEDSRLRRGDRKRTTASGDAHTSMIQRRSRRGEGRAGRRQASRRGTLMTFSKKVSTLGEEKELQERER